MADPFDPLALHAVRLGLLDRSVLSDAQRAQLARPVAAPPLLIDLVEPDAPEPWGDRLPCHLLMREVEWHAPLPANLSVLASAFGALGYSPALDYVDYPGNSAFLKAPAPAVPVCPPCHGRCHQGRSCPSLTQPSHASFPRFFGTALLGVSCAVLFLAAALAVADYVIRPLIHLLP